MSEFDRLVGELEARLDQLVDSTLERLSRRFPGWSSETSFSRGQIAEFTRASLATQLRAFRRDALPKRCPDLDAVAARWVARVGELETFSSGYRAAQAALWEAWFGLVEDSPGIEGAQRRELLSRGSDFFFRYADLLGDYVTAVYRDEFDQLRKDNGQRRFRAIKALLEGDPLPSSQTDLDLDPAQHHLGLLAWGEGADEAARRLARDLRRRLLIVPTVERNWWGWISGTQPLDSSGERALESFQPPAGTGLALGLQGFGEAGFRASHRQAQRARWAARWADSRLIRYADVAVESLAAENELEARAFVARELRGIEDDSATSRQIRRTLSAYFAAEHNAASAAAALGVHQQTVANRLRRAEERLGHPVGSRRVELEVALRLRAALDRGES